VLIPFAQVVEMWQPKYPPRILHLGAHLGEERDAYEDCGASYVLWVEANAALIPELCEAVCAPRSGEKPLGTTHRVIHALVTDQDGQRVTFHVADNTQTSSVLNVGTNPVTYVDSIDMDSTTVDTLTERWGQATFLNADVQGLELAALQGARRTLQGTEAVYCEISEEETYEGCPHWSEIDRLLREEGFRLAHVEMTRSGDGWGDALWVRRGLG
jgi:FkbM family methyltransferase